MKSLKLLIFIIIPLFLQICSKTDDPFLDIWCQNNIIFIVFFCNSFLRKWSIWIQEFLFYVSPCFVRNKEKKLIYILFLGLSFAHRLSNVLNLMVLICIVREQEHQLALVIGEIRVFLEFLMLISSTNVRFMASIN